MTNEPPKLQDTNKTNFNAGDVYVYTGTEWKEAETSTQSNIILMAAIRDYQDFFKHLFALCDISLISDNDARESLVMIRDSITKKLKEFKNG